MLIFLWLGQAVAMISALSQAHPTWQFTVLIHPKMLAVAQKLNLELRIASRTMESCKNRQDTHLITTSLLVMHFLPEPEFHKPAGGMLKVAIWLKHPVF